MEESASADRALPDSAQERAKKPPEDYIISAVNNRENPYTINRIYTDGHEEEAAPQPSAVPAENKNIT